MWWHDRPFHKNDDFFPHSLRIRWFFSLKKAIAFTKLRYCSIYSFIIYTTRVSWCCKVQFFVAEVRNCERRFFWEKNWHFVFFLFSLPLTQFFLAILILIFFVILVIFALYESWKVFVTRAKTIWVEIPPREMSISLNMLLYKAACMDYYIRLHAIGIRFRINAITCAMHYRILAPAYCSLLDDIDIWSVRSQVTIPFKLYNKAFTCAFTRLENYSTKMDKKKVLGKNPPSQIILAWGLRPETIVCYYKNLINF